MSDIDIEVEKQDKNQLVSSKLIHDDYKKGVFFMLLSACGFAVMNLFVRLSGNLPTVQKSMFRNLVAFVVAMIFLSITISFKNRDKKKVNSEIIEVKKSWHKYINREMFWLPLLFLFLRSFFGLIGILFNFYAIDHIPVAEASLFNKTAPFFMIIFSFLILKERIKVYQILAIIVAFIGVIIISFSGMRHELTHDYKSYLIALIGGMSAALAYTMVRILGKRNIDPNLIICFFSAFSCLSIMPSFIATYQKMTLEQVVMLIGAGIGARIGQYGITFAYRYPAAKHISIFDYSTIVFTAILSAIFIGEYPTVYSYLGALLIFLAALYIFWVEKK